MLAPALPERSVRAVLAGIEAAVLTWLVAALLAMVAYASTAAAPGLGDVTWSHATALGTKFWVLAFGGRVAFDSGSFSLIPLGLTIFSAAVLRGSMKRAGLHTALQIAVAATGFALSVGLLGLVGAMGLGWHWLGALLLGLGVGVSLFPRGNKVPSERIRGWIQALPVEVRTGVRDGGWFAAFLAPVGVALALGAVALSWTQIVALGATLNMDVVSVVVFGLIQFAYLANAGLWALAWMAGPGFMVGSGTAFTPFGVVTEPLPSIPAFAALPAPGTEPGLIVLLLPVAIGATYGLVRERLLPESWVSLALRTGGAFLTLFGASFSAMLLSSGSIGGGRMTEIGTPVGLATVAALSLAGLVVAGYGLVIAARITFARWRDSRRQEPDSGHGFSDDLAD